ncbi:MAG: adenosylmethionine decarboxylase [Archaeoglobi archaeon]|nr:adenosylmethionine decarboxylase [Candidatus Mnemosynella sp.]
MKALGKHIIIELWGCDREMLDSQEVVEKALVEATEKCNATLLKVVTHKFAPQGVSGVAVIAESHISIHTWPELGYAALDIFTCGNADPYNGIPVFKEYFRASKANIMEIKRGVNFD